MFRFYLIFSYFSYFSANFHHFINNLKGWVANEKEKINNEPGLQESERKALLAELLNKETKLLQTIDRLKIKAGHDNKSEAIKGSLKEVEKILY